ncbi:serine protease [Gymnodinialimonas hymeniacidonis]|uniref:trypsin-like serine peptidase n=1 Tax=Gymnodinialimonas hymeniacidonis TaxID=3126508 RepID=UPI0034C5D75D
MYRVYFALLACLLAIPLSAQVLPQVRPGDGESGLRDMASATEARQWRAVGRLDTGVSFCSATLIAPDLVLTAAHCVYHPETHALLDAEDLTFLAGLRNGRAEAIRQVRRTIVMPGYRHELGPELEMIGRDLALLELRQPISPATIPHIGAAATRVPDGDVTVVSYGEDREAYASIEEGCEVLARQGAVRSLSCEVAQGTSGAPVLHINQGRAQVIAVMSASGHADGEDISLAVMLNGQLDTLMQQRNASGATATFTTFGGSTSFVSPSNDTRDGIGARFVRP